MRLSYKDPLMTRGAHQALPPVGKLLPVLQPDVSCPVQKIPFALIAASPFPPADIVNRIANELHHMEAVHRERRLWEFILHGIAVSMAHVACYILLLILLALEGGKRFCESTYGVSLPFPSSISRTRALEFLSVGCERNTSYFTKVVGLSREQEKETGEN